MSSFLSNKYLRYRGLSSQAPRPIDRDLFCMCSYNLRGLTTGRNCPECGRPISLTRPFNDPLSMGELFERRLVMIGLALIAICPLFVALARIGFSVVWALQPGSEPLWPYILRGVAIGAIWMAGLWLITPRRLQINHPRMTWLRLATRFSQPLWVVVYLCWLLAETKYAFTGTGDKLRVYSAVCAGPAALGALGAGVWLLVLAGDAGLDEAANRLNLALWVTPIMSLLVSFIPLQLPFFALGFLFIILLPWAWYMLQFSRGVWEVQRHVSWSIRMGLDVYDRTQRIAQVRSEIDREAAAQIRPLPPSSGRSDLPIAPRE